MRVPAAAPARLGDAEARAVREAVERVLRDGPWILGPEVEGFEEAFARYTGLRHAVGVGNGTDALVVAFTALGLSPGAGVLVAADEGGYAATAARIAGLVPVVMDLDPASLTVTASTAEHAHRPDVEAVVVTHLHGDAVPLDGIDAWRRRRGLALVEDCAQAHGLRVDGRHVGGTGDAATFSFYPTKNLGAIGDGGLVAFADEEVAERARALRQYGWAEERFRVDLPHGRNTRLDPLQAAVLSARLPHLDERNARRRAIADRWRHALSGRAALWGDPLTTVAHHAVVVTVDRDDLARHLAGHGVETAVHYPHLVGDMPGLRVEGRGTPVAADTSRRILSLPCFPELTDEEVHHVETALREWEPGAQ
ncbi:DegT/DnrJ/EryC1/StrS family aminotransferase [Nocardioides KLBMP 9356]|uniref:DegT/DnrJ/EryC1/StrS family aminotransferase n=1 Tax=Nocardioides potassii TaxID=2911371 RepID=A0ABS9H480_9ACTN|nr:DegT/DnrJ/EryC1/StrS family aminotransferase [Nocardioides potassii]MCF6376061.1 DegT/DnrJ/EryC1/StrS family aminotransferase [Nocardioides potassii]